MYQYLKFAICGISAFALIGCGSTDISPVEEKSIVQSDEVRTPVEKKPITLLNEGVVPTGKDESDFYLTDDLISQFTGNWEGLFDTWIRPKLPVLDSFLVPLSNERETKNAQLAIIDGFKRFCSSSDGVLSVDSSYSRDVWAKCETTLNELIGYVSVNLYPPKSPTSTRNSTWKLSVKYNTPQIESQIKKLKETKESRVSESTKGRVELVTGEIVPFYGVKVKEQNKGSEKPVFANAVLAASFEGYLSKKYYSSKDIASIDYYPKVAPYNHSVMLNDGSSSLLRSSFVFVTTETSSYRHLDSRVYLVIKEGGAENLISINDIGKIKRIYIGDAKNQAINKVRERHLAAILNDINPSSASNIAKETKSLEVSDNVNLNMMRFVGLTLMKTLRDGANLKFDEGRKNSFNSGEIVCSFGEVGFEMCLPISVNGESNCKKQSVKGTLVGTTVSKEVDKEILVLVNGIHFPEHINYIVERLTIKRFVVNGQDVEAQKVSTMKSQTLRKCSI